MHDVGLRGGLFLARAWGGPWGSPEGPFGMQENQEGANVPQGLFREPNDIEGSAVGLFGSLMAWGVHGLWDRVGRCRRASTRSCGGYWGGPGCLVVYAIPLASV